MKKDYLKNDYYFNNEVEKSKKQINWYLTSYKNQIEMLKTVKKVHKKDWSDFQNFLKNFTYADWLKMYYYDLVWEKDEIILSWYMNNEYEKIYLYTYTSDEDFIEKIEKSDPWRIVKPSCYKDRVYYTVEEFMQQIQDRIEKYTKNVEELEKTLENYDKNIEKLESLLDPLLQFIWNVEDIDIARYLRDIAKVTIGSFYDYKS